MGEDCRADGPALTDDVQQADLGWRPIRLFGGDREASARLRRALILSALTLALTALAFAAAYLVAITVGYELRLPLVESEIYWSIYPPLPIAVLAMFWLGFTPALTIITLANLLYGAAAGLEGPWLLLYAVCDSLALVIFAMAFSASRRTVDLRSRDAKLVFAFAAFAASVSILPGAMVWIAGGYLDSPPPNVLQTWVLGALVAFFLIVAPALRFLTVPVLRWRSRLFGPPSPGDVSRLSPNSWFGAFLGISFLYVAATDALVRIRVDRLLEVVADPRLAANVVEVLRLYGVFAYALLLLMTGLVGGLLYVRARLADEMQAQVDARTRELRRTVRQLEHAQHLAQTGAWQLDLDSGELEWSAGIYSMFGIEPDEFGARYEAFFERVHPDDRGPMQAAQDRALQGLDPLDIEHRIVLPGGEVRWVHERGGLRYGDDGRPRFLVGTVIDVTEWRRREQESREAEARRLLLEAAVDQAREAIVVADTDGAIVYASVPFERFGNRSRDRLHGSRLEILFDDTGQPSGPIWRALHDGRSWTERVERAGDPILHFEVAISPAMDPDGSLQHLVAVYRDVSEQVRLEAQFRQAQKMEALGQLAGGVAHDFNNLLQVISGFTRFALEAELPAEARADLEEAQAAADRGAALVRQLLVFSRSEPARHSAVEIGELLEGVSTLIGRMIGENYELVVEAAPDLPTIHADPGQLEQILMNLCINARDAMPGGGTVRIEAREVELVPDDQQGVFLDPGRYLELRVGDSGAGMSPQVQQHIFEPFYTTKEVGKGTGLGLATVYGIVNQHGGHVDVQSVEGEGTTMLVLLPLGLDSLPVAAVESGPGELVSGVETVLLAEDDDLVRRFAARVLHRAGYRVLVATDGEEAVEIAARHAGEIEVAILDVVMPRRNGSEVWEAVRALSPEAVVVFTTGYSMGLLDASVAPARTHNVLAKPYEIGELLRAIRRALGDAEESAARIG